MSHEKSFLLIASATFGDNRKKTPSANAPTKAQRLDEFKAAFEKAEPAANVIDAWTMMSTILREIEDNHDLKEKMSIPSLEFKTTRSYGGGVCIHLIGHNLYINGNGAIRIADHLDNVFCEKPAQDGSDFKRISNWEYFHNTPQVQHLRILNKAKAHQLKLVSQAKYQHAENYKTAKADHLKKLKNQK